MNTRTWQTRDTAGLFFVAGVSVAAFALSVANGFVFDDVRIIVDQTELHDLGNWWDILRAPWWSNALYRPVTKLWFAVDWAISDGSPAYFHAVNVVLHGLVTVLLYCLVRPMSGTVGAITASLLFAVHPVHVEAVANVVGRAEILAALFTIAAAILYRWDGQLARAGTRGWGRAASSLGTVACVMFGFGSKESAFALPGVLLLMDWYAAKQANETFSAAFRRHWFVGVAAIIIAAEWLLLRSTILGDVAGDHPGPGLWGQDFVGRFLIMAPVILQYARLFLFPLRLSADYSPDYVPAVAAVTAAGVAGVLVVVACAVIAIRYVNRNPTITFGLAWIGGTLIVIANIITPTGVLLAERSLYLPSVGAVIVAGAMASQTWRRWPRATVAVVAVIATLGAIRSVARIPVWKDDTSFYPRMVTDAPGSFRSLWVAGMLLYQLDEPEQGEYLLKSAIAVYPVYANLWQDLGRQLQHQDRWEEAATAFSTAFRIDSTRVYDAAAAASSYLQANMLDSAKALTRRGIEVDPHHPRLYAARGDIALAEDEPMKAMVWRRLAAVFVGDDANYWYLTARAAAKAEYCPEATRSLGRARALADSLPLMEEFTSRLHTMGCVEDGASGRDGGGP